MSAGDYILHKSNGTTIDEKIILAEANKVLGFDASLNPIMVEPGTDYVESLVTNITYDELVALVAASELEPGLYYRITDFATKHYIIDNGDVWLDGEGDPEIVTGETEPLIVQALDVNVLSHEAKSELYPNDVIHYDWNPDNWIYDIAFANYDEEVLTGWKGVIYWRHYTLNDISAPGDWRNVKCRRWALDDTPSGFDTVYAGIGSTADGVSDPDDYEDYRMFEETAVNPLDERVVGLEIKPSRDRHNLGYLVPTILPNIVFHVMANHGFWQIINIEIGRGSYNNTFGGYVFNSTFGDNVSNNIIGIGFIYNTIGNNFYYNTIVSYFVSNTIGNDCYSNTIDDNFSNNTIGNFFSENTISYDFSENTIGNRFMRNTIGYDFSKNTIGNWFMYNTIGTYFSKNTIGNEFSNNTIGRYFNNNEIENYVQYLKTPNKLYSTSFRNNVIRSGVRGVAASKIDFTAGSHVFADYNCEIFIASDDNIKLSYIKEDTGNYALEIVDYNA